LTKLLALFIFVLGFALLVPGGAMAQSSSVDVTVRPNPLVVNLDSPSAVVVRQWFDVTAEITNRGNIELTRATVNLLSPKGISVKGKKKNIKNLPAGETVIVTWSAKANSVGDFVVTAEAQGELLDEKIKASDTSMISALGSISQRLIRLFFRA